MGDFFHTRIVETGRLPLFFFFVAFIATFVLTRINVRLIRADAKWWFKNVKAGDVHIHHVVFGVILMLVGGVLGIAAPALADNLTVASAAVFGVGAALVLDEFALILHLEDVYWTERGRTSVDAVFVALALTGLLLLGIRPVGFEDLSTESAEFGRAVGIGIYVATLVANLVLAVVVLLKGKIWTGLIGLFVPFLLWLGAVRLARPSSPWARWRYRPGSYRYRRAVWREERLRRPLIRAKIWLQEFIAGRHDRLPPVLRPGRHAAASRQERVPHGSDHEDPGVSGPSGGRSGIE
ncbi:hypothetical protein ACSNOI_41375 [Actinomadura kijaniata]|uniref:hypothetical protein n=1 Tax=Actinomadura kijaniata TaxID=46161 RepID=UPI003F1D0669